MLIFHSVVPDVSKLLVLGKALWIVNGFDTKCEGFSQEGLDWVGLRQLSQLCWMGPPKASVVVCEPPVCCSLS